MDDDEDGDVCRVCRDVSNEQPLYHPCRCTGTMAYVHSECLMHWLDHKKKDQCEICRYPYVFMPVYDADMPASIPLLVIIRGALMKARRFIFFINRCALVVASWLIFVPFMSKQIWNVLLYGEFAALSDFMNICLQGWLIATGVAILFMGIVGLQDFLMTNMDSVADLDLDLAGALVPPEVPEDAAHAAPVGAGRDVGGRGNGAAAVDVAGDAAAAAGGGDGGGGGLENNNANVVGAFVGNAVDADAGGRGGGGGGGGIFGGWADVMGAQEEVTFEEMIGLSGPISVMFENLFFVMVFVLATVGVFVAFPFALGYIAYVSLEIVGVKSTSIPLDAKTRALVGSMGFLLFTSLMWLTWRFMRLIQDSFGVVDSGTRILRVIFKFMFTFNKVSMLVLVELGMFPLLCGIWLDICTLRITGALLSSRIDYAKSNTYFALFLHWVCGMLFMYNLSWFIAVMRRIARPGVFWFLRDPEDPAFHPVREMIQLPFVRHARRILLSAVLYGTFMLIVIWSPVTVASYLPGLLPFRLYFRDPITSVSLDMLFIHIVVPWCFPRVQKISFGRAVRFFMRSSASSLGMTAYLLPAPTDATGAGTGTEDASDDDWDDDDLHIWEWNDDNAAGPGRRNRERRDVNYKQPYVRPRFFVVRLCLLISFISVIIAGTTLCLLVVPMLTGRVLLYAITVVFNYLHLSTVSSTGDGDGTPHDFYAWLGGLCIFWIMARACQYVVKFSNSSRDWTLTLRSIGRFGRIALSWIVVALCVGVIIPLILGILFDAILIAPLWVPVRATPVSFFMQHWAIGAIHTKALHKLILQGPDNYVKQALIRARTNGFGGVCFTDLFRNGILPVMTMTLSVLLAPVLIGRGLIATLLRYLVQDSFALNTSLSAVARFSHVGCFIILGLFFGLRQSRRWLIELKEAIKRDKYLVGKTIVDFPGNNANGTVE